MSGSLSDSFCTAADRHHGHGNQLSHHLHALHWHAYEKLSRDTSKQTLGECVIKEEKKTVHRKENQTSCPCIWSTGTEKNKMNSIA